MVATKQARRFCARAVMVAVTAMVAGCGGDKTREGHAPTPNQSAIAAKPVYPVLEGTVSEFAAIAPMSAQYTRVEGYGLVANLPNTGSADMPPPVRAMLLEQLYQEGAGSAIEGTERFDPQKILSTRQVAAVAVYGYIPPMAAADTTFDLFVSALPGTQTTSLREGVLWTTNLKVVGLTESGPTSSTLAKGRGPVFCNPYSLVDTPDGPKANVRVGRVLSGGIMINDSPIFMQTYTPSFRTSMLIQRVINSRFPAQPPTCNAQNDRLLILTLPDNYRRHPKDFVDLISHMYLAQDVPGFADRKIDELIAALHKPDAPKMELSLALEGLGRIVLTKLRQQYSATDPAVRYYAARAGAALQDIQAIAVLEEIALAEGDPFQYDAVTTVARYGESDRASDVLLKIIGSSNNNRLRISAYEGLVSIDSPELHSYTVGRKFIVDRIITDSAPMIYATSSGLPRIAIIGKKFDLPTGLLYVSPDNMLTISVEDPMNMTPEVVPPPIPMGERNKPTTPVPQPPRPVVIYYRGPLGDKSITLRSRPQLTSVLATMGDTPDPRSPAYNPLTPYIGANYQRAVEMLNLMCKDKSIDATFVMQRPEEVGPNLAELADQARPDAPTTQKSPQ